jgi:hypothetical protein
MTARAPAIGLCYIPRMGVIRGSSVRRGGLDRGAQRSPLASGLLLTAVLSVVAVTGLGCGSTKTTTTTAPVSTSPAATTATTSATPAPTAGLSGTWSGQYSGAFQGTFTLTWTQTGTNLNGTIQLSPPPRTLGITGTVQGSAITFGAVGGVSYSGSVTGSSMSGTYQTPTANGATGSGSWSATKAS